MNKKSPSKEGVKPFIFFLFLNNPYILKTDFICMESVNKGAVALIVALILVGGVGYMFNVTDQSTTKTTYTNIGSVDALFAANSSPVRASEIFNSVYNVTGWTGDIDLTNVKLTGTQTNQYVYKEAETVYDPQTVDYNYAEHGYILNGHYNGRHNLPDTIPLRNSLKTTLSDSDKVFFSVYMPTATELQGKLYKYEVTTNTGYGESVGGYGQTTHYDVPSTSIARPSNNSYSIKLNDNIVASPGDNKLFLYNDLSSLLTANRITPVHNMRIYITSGDVGYIGGYTSTYSVTRTVADNQENYTGQTAITGRVSTDIEYLRYDRPTQQWNAYDSSDHRVWNESNILIYSTSSTAYSLEVRTYRVIPAVYLSPNKYMDIDGEAVWSNTAANSSFQNTEITFLFKGTGTVKLNNDGPTIKIGMDGSEYIVYSNDDSYTIIGNYKGLVITASQRTGELYARGIITEEVDPNGNPNSMTYTATSFTYDIPFYKYTGTIPIITKLTVNGNDVKMYIAETWVLTDPMGYLWGNPSINVANYFADYKDKLRILIQGVVAYGDSITINGKSYDVTDGTIKVTVQRTTTVPITTTDDLGNEVESTEEVTENVDYYIKLSGMAIDFINEHVYLSSADGKVTNLDIGQTTSYVIGGTGTWYFSSTASEIKVINTTEKVWNPGWDLSWNATLLLFIGIMLLILCVILTMFKESMTTNDWLVFIGSIVIAFSLLVVS